MARNEQRLDKNQIVYISSMNVNRWLALRLEFVGQTSCFLCESSLICYAGAVIILITSCLAIAALITTGVDAGLVGLVLTYALNTTSSLVSWLQISICKNAIEFVNRIGWSAQHLR